MSYPRICVSAATCVLAVLQVQKADDCIGDEVKQKTQALNNGEVAQSSCFDPAADSSQLYEGSKLHQSAGPCP